MGVLHACMSVHLCAHCLRQPAAVPGLEVQMNGHVGPRQEQQVSLTTEPSLQTLSAQYFKMKMLALV